MDAFEDVKNFAMMHGCQLSVARLNQIGKSTNNKVIGRTINTFFEHLTDDNMVKVSNVIPLCQMPISKRHLCHSCSAGLASVCVDADATVKICGSATQVIGSLKKSSLFEVWNSDEFVKFRSLDWLPSLCRNCRDFARCLGGCKVEKYENSYSDSCDSLLTMAIEEFFNECKNKNIEFHFTNVRRMGSLLSDSESDISPIVIELLLTIGSFSISDISSPYL